MAKVTTNQLFKRVLCIALGCIVHPSASIVAENGCSIVFGDYNIIEERVSIIAKGVKDPEGNIQPVTMEIGSYNLFEIGTTMENSRIGSYNMFEMKSEFFFYFILFT